MTDPILEAREITKDFGYRKLLKGVNFQLRPSEFTLLLGKNGEGKSTLLKIVTGLMRPKSGEVLFQGGNVKEDPDAFRASFGVISHAAHFYNELTAKENLTFFAKLRGVPGYEAKITSALSRVGLTRFANSPTGTFSSGMFKRLNIAKLMVFEPKILLLDEPYTGLDYDSVDFFNDYLKEFKASGGCILMITHQLDTCFDQTDQILILKNGVASRLDKQTEYSYQELLSAYQEFHA